MSIPIFWTRSQTCTLARVSLWQLPSGPRFAIHFATDSKSSYRLYSRDCNRSNRARSTKYCIVCVYVRTTHIVQIVVVESPFMDMVYTTAFRSLMNWSAKASSRLHFKQQSIPMVFSIAVANPAIDNSVVERISRSQQQLPQRAAMRWLDHVYTVSLVRSMSKLLLLVLRVSYNTYRLYDMHYSRALCTHKI